MRYDPATGEFFWAVRRGRLPAGSIAGGVWRSKSKREVRYVIRFNGRAYQANRLAWLIMTGEWPAALVDHEDRDTLNNRWSNLREASGDQNASNAGVRADSSTGLKGVSYRKESRLFVARIQAGKTRTYLGQFATAEEAYAAYCAAGRELHGSFFSEGAAR